MCIPINPEGVASDGALDATLTGLRGISGGVPRVDRCAVNPGLVDGTPLAFAVMSGGISRQPIV
jgi:hypothetical protein